MVDKQKIIEFIRSHGPALPNEIATHLKESSFIVGALLSELSRSGGIKVSKLKVGGSPLYYLNEHKHKLQDYADYLNEKDREAFELLKEKGVLYDKDQTPLLRVSLRTITDFAVPVRVSVNNAEELFWRWYLTPLESVEEKIKARFSEQQSKDTEETKKEPPQESEQNEAASPEPAKKQEQAQSNETNFPEKEVSSEQQEKLASASGKKEESKTEDELDQKTKDFFYRNNIGINTEKQLRKNQELEYEITVPSAIGDLKYYCRVKSKKKLNENDLANAYLAGKKKELPVLLITTGDLTKKAENSLNSDFPGMKVKNMG